MSAVAISLELLGRLAPEKPINDGEFGCCVFCYATPRSRPCGHATAAPEDHDPDCPWAAARRLLAGSSSAHELTTEIAALRKDLGDALLALRHLRSCQHRPPIIDHDSEHWWQAAVEEADAVLTRFEK